MLIAGQTRTWSNQRPGTRRASGQTITLNAEAPPNGRRYLDEEVGYLGSGIPRADGLLECFKGELQSAKPVVADVSWLRDMGLSMHHLTDPDNPSRDSMLSYDGLREQESQFLPSHAD